MSQSSGFKLSICIATFNRAAFIGDTLESVVCQATNECEIVVTDNASTDDTERVVSEYARRCDHLRYLRHETNKGLDRNYDSAVELARGEYCWLMADDDLIRPGAIAHVLGALQRGPSLLIVNKEYRDFTMSRVVQRTALSFDSDRVYKSSDMDRLFTDVNQDLLMYIGGVVIKREVWLARERERFYGSLFIHVGVIFQEHLPGDALVVAEPLVSYRLGNRHAYSQLMIEIIFNKWPSVVKSLAISDTARKKIPRAEPWAHPAWLLLMRGWGFYSIAEYRQWIRPQLRSVSKKLVPALIALLPGTLVNTVLASYFFVRQDRGRWLQAMRNSPNHVMNWRVGKQER